MQLEELTVEKLKGISANVDEFKVKFAGAAPSSSICAIRQIPGQTIFRRRSSGQGRGTYPADVNASGLCLQCGYRYHGTGSYPTITGTCFHCHQRGRFLSVCRA